ncbi:MAG: type II CAAX endopeptidase family protein [Bacteroidota bacterium]|nr:type II CAAX endopeptidase family protein [Bacteroidota bacterium]
MNKHKAPLWFQLGLALMFLLVIAFFSGLGEDNGSIQQFKNDLRMITMLKVMQAVAVFFVFILPVILFSIVLRKEKMKFLNLGRLPKASHFFIGLLICIVALPLVSGTSVINEQMHLPASMSGVESWMRMKEKAAGDTIALFFMDKSTSGLIINLVVVAFMAGLSEEIFFRGLIQRLFMDNKVNLHVSVWVTAILFSAIHLQFFGFIPRMLLGAVLGYLYAYTNNLWVPILAHTINNAFAVVMVFITGEITDDPLSKNEQAVGWPLILLSTLLVIGMVLFLFKRRDKEETSIIASP